MIQIISYMYNTCSLYRLISRRLTLTKLPEKPYLSVASDDDVDERVKRIVNGNGKWRDNP